MEKKQESHKHHFVPQFILKNFADDEKQLYHWDNVEKKLEKKSVSEVFMDNDMYRDEKQSAENPTAIEDDFSVFERKIAMLIQDKIIDQSEIRISKKENEELRIFLTLLSLRSRYRKEQYINDSFDSDTRKELFNYQQDSDFESLWKRELGLLAKIRNYDKIRKNKNIDAALKREFFDDYDNFYMSFIETEEENFLITDVNPTSEVYPLDIYCAMHYLYPLSPKRMLLLSHNEFINGKNGSQLYNYFKCFSKIDGKLYEHAEEESDHMKDKEEYIYLVKKCSKESAMYLNCLLLNETRKEMGFKNPNLIIDTLKKYENIRHIKNDYKLLKQEIEEKIKKSVDT